MVLQHYRQTETTAILHFAIRASQLIVQYHNIQLVDDAVNYW